ncbi:MAG: 6-bladed beta-propeller [Rhodocyclaceae bacterium]|nr:6-bladed beta-propeller [Rhodocyclaceae bacterium]
MNKAWRTDAIAGGRWACMVGAMALVVAACAPVSKVAEKRVEDNRLVYPAPPDAPRFAYERTIHGSADVIPEKEESALKRALTGESDSSERLGKPYAVATYRGRIFVSDTANRFIHVFDVPQGTYTRIGDSDGEGKLVKPLGLDIDAAGTLYVADATAKTIVVFDNEGKFLRKIGGSKYFDRLTSVTVDPSGERVYVVDIGGVQSENHRVRAFDARKGAHLFDIGKRGSGAGELNLPRDLAIGKDGQLYVVDGGNFRVQVFDRDGKYLKSFGNVGKQPGSFARPKEVATDRDGNVYVVDTAFGNFQIFNAEGELLMFVGDRAEQDRPGGYMLPSGISIDEDGRIYFVDQWFRKIDIFRPYALKASDGYLVYRPKTPKPVAQ